MTWAEDNLPRICTIMVMAGHIKDDLRSAKHHSCLLKSRIDSFVDSLLDKFSKLMGAYLCYDKENCRFVRSGKVFGNNRDFAVRNDEHEEG